MSGLGNQLRAARESKRATVTEAAAATHLKMLVIDAMERDDFPKLIAPTYAKGFYRLYCEYLGLDAEPFVEAYLEAIGGPEDKAELLRLAKENGLIVTGGTDYHGMNTVTPRPVGAFSTRDEEIARLNDLAKARKATFKRNN